MKIRGTSVLFALAGIVAGCVDHKDSTMGPPGINAAATSITAVTNWFVKPNGSTSNSGTSYGAPWPLTYALHGAAGRIQPGDTVWMEGGTYGPDSDYVADAPNGWGGTVANRVVFKQYPGEHATIDGRLQVQNAHYLTFWGFEVMESDPSTHVDQGNGGWYGIVSYGGSYGVRYIRLVIHDAAKSGILLDWPNGNAEIDGCIIYNNGDNFDHNPFHHGIYVQGNGTNGGGQYVRTNVVFNNLSYGIHAFSDNTAALKSIYLSNNVSFNNGTISSNGPKSNFLIGSSFTNSSDLLMTTNTSYFGGSPPGTFSQGEGFTMGWPNTQASDMRMEWNTSLGGRRGLHIYKFTTGTVRYNTVALIDPGYYEVDLEDPLRTDSYQWYGNFYYRDPTASRWLVDSLSSPPWVDLTTFLHLTGFENQSPIDAGTADPYPLRWELKDISYVSNEQFLLVFDPDGSGAVNLPLGSGWLKAGDHYSLYNVQQDMWGSPIASGTYDGSSLSVPMTAVTPPAPIDASTRNVSAGPTTGPYWNVFLIRKG